MADTFSDSYATFVTEEQWEFFQQAARTVPDDSLIIEAARMVRSANGELIRWLRKLPYFFETERQIFVHAGVDEEAGDWWRYGAPEYVFAGKFPRTTGSFYKDIIAAYAGAGKSTVAARFENAADAASMPRHRILPPQKSEEEGERGKGRMDVLTDPLYLDNYIVDILRGEREYDYVLIPTDMRVVRRLREEYGRQVVLCYPADELKEEYRERFIARGNSEDFLELFIGDWDGFLKPVREYKDAAHMVMGPGEYLTDLKERLDRELLRNDTKPVPEETITALERKLQGRRHDYALWIGPRLWYRITDILDPDERLFLAEFARKAYKAYKTYLISYDAIMPISYTDKLRAPDGVITDDKAQVLEYLEKYDYK